MNRAELHTLATGISFWREVDRDRAFKLGREADLTGLDVSLLAPTEPPGGWQSALAYASKVCEYIVGATDMGPEVCRRNLGAYREGLQSNLYEHVFVPLIDRSWRTP
jgi:hypothetical protein